MKIVVDGFGGDHAPNEVVAGCVLATEKFEDLEIVLVGNQDVLNNLLKENGYNGNRIEVLHSETIITNDDVPTHAIRQKKDSSLVVAFDYINEHPEVDGFVSAGSTGAVLTGALLKLGRLEGIKRPALAPPIPNKNGGYTLLIDCGANMDSKPEFLAQFALMGSIYMKKMYGIENPRVALLNVGVEDKKGNDLAHQAFAILKDMKNINFVGNMEARDLTSGEYDVVVSDGFAGNVALKSTEGAVVFVTKMIKEEIKKGSLFQKIGALLMKGVFNKIKTRMDYNAVGGSPFLGCKKVVVKSHGSSDRVAILGSITLVRKLALAGFVEELDDELKTLNLGE